jgi:hypothetical protein
MFSVRAADLFDTKAINNLENVAGRGKSVFDKMLDDPFISDDTTLGKAVEYN